MKTIDLLCEISKIMQENGLKSYNATVLDLENLLIDKMDKEIEELKKLAGR
jgi:hypothetical protein